MTDTDHEITFDFTRDFVADRRYVHVSCSCEGFHEWSSATTQGWRLVTFEAEVHLMNAGVLQASALAS